MFRFFKKNNILFNESIHSLRTPKKLQLAPKPLSENQIKSVTNEANLLNVEPWIIARDISIMLLPRRAISLCQA